MAKDKLDKLIDETTKILKEKETKQMKTKLSDKTIKVTTMIKVTVFSFILLAIGAYAGITVNNAIKNTIDNQVQTKTAEQVKVFTQELK